MQAEEAEHNFEPFVLTTLHLYFFKITTIHLSLSQGIKRILAFLRLHKKHLGCCCCCCFIFPFFLFFSFKVSYSWEKPKLPTCVWYGLSAADTSLALCTSLSDWWMNGKAFTIINPRSCLHNKQNDTQLPVGIDFSSSVQLFFNKWAQQSLNIEYLKSNFIPSPMDYSLFHSPWSGYPHDPCITALVLQLPSTSAGNFWPMLLFYPVFLG